LFFCTNLSAAEISNVLSCSLNTGQESAVLYIDEIQNATFSIENKSNVNKCKLAIANIADASKHVRSYVELEFTKVKCTKADNRLLDQIRLRIAKDRLSKKETAKIFWSKYEQASVCVLKLRDRKVIAGLKSLNRVPSSK